MPVRRNIWVFRLISGCLFLGFSAWGYGCSHGPNADMVLAYVKGKAPGEPSHLTLLSPVFKESGLIPAKYTCDGPNISPPLYISGIPKGAKSLALIMDDPDAPRGVWTHWLLWNIPPKTPIIAEAHSPDRAMQGSNSFRQIGYSGPCPPKGLHHYRFKLYALDERLNLQEHANQKALETQLTPYIISMAQLTGTYARIDKKQAH